MNNSAPLDRALAPGEIEAFVREGFVKVERAFTREVAEQGRAILWRDTGCNPDDASTWTKPVIRLGMYGQLRSTRRRRRRCSRTPSTSWSGRAAGYRA